MQTFLPYPDFKKSAQCLDYQRLGKQRLECKQILQTLALKKYKEYFKEVWICDYCNKPKNPNESNFITYLSNYDIFCKCLSDSSIYQLTKNWKISWENHPAVLMWQDNELQLCEYTLFIIDTWINKGYKDNIQSLILNIRFTEWKVYEEIKLDYPGFPEWFGDTEFHLSHQSNLVRKYPEYYRKYFPEIPDNLPYIWPVRISYE